jgi:hypothetical protein
MIHIPQTHVAYPSLYNVYNKERAGSVQEDFQRMEDSFAFFSGKELKYSSQRC